LDGEIGEYAVVVRKERDGKDWFLGAITNEKGRELKVSLSFLPATGRYVAERYRDAEKADWKTNPYAFETSRQRVGSDSELVLRLAPGGGQAIRFRPAGEDESLATRP
jgi:alpha-glucosidase